VRSLVFDETLVADFTAVPRAEDIVNGFGQGLSWRQKPDGNYELTRLVGGRVVVTNYDPLALSDQERFELNERIKKNPQGFVFLDISPDGPGGDRPLIGAIKLRSLYRILGFLGRGIEEAPEVPVAVEAFAGTGEASAVVTQEPVATMQINATSDAPRADVPAIAFGDRYYWLNDTKWDRFSFTLLSILFQTAVGEVENVGVPITIAK
jgi:hypothetical protein